MDKSKIDIWVYAHWVGMKESQMHRYTYSTFCKGEKVFQF